MRGAGRASEGEPPVARTAGSGQGSCGHLVNFADTNVVGGSPKVLVAVTFVGLVEV